MPFWKAAAPAAAKGPTSQAPPPLRTKPSRLLAKFKRGNNNKTVEDLLPGPVPERVFHRGPTTWPEYGDEAKEAEETTALYLRQREEFAAERRREEEGEERERKRRGMVFLSEDGEGEEEEGSGEGAGGEEEERERGEEGDRERWMVAGRELESLSLTPHLAAHLRAENARLSAALAQRDAQIAALERRLAPPPRHHHHLTSAAGLEDPFFSPASAPAPAPRSPSRSSFRPPSHATTAEEERPLSPTLPPPPVFAGRRERRRGPPLVGTPLRRR